MDLITAIGICAVGIGVQNYVVNRIRERMAVREAMAARLPR
jgi:hypothetical protein